MNNPRLGNSSVQKAHINKLTRCGLYDAMEKMRHPQTEWNKNHKPYSNMGVFSKENVAKQ